MGDGTKQSTEQVRRGPSMRYGRIILATITLISALICIRIELLNYAAGGYLPHDEPGKWRVGELAVRLHLESTGVPPDSAEYQDAIRKARANSELRDFVGSAGLLQFLIAPLVIIAAIGMLVDRRSTWLALSCIAVELVCLGMAIHRNYLYALN